MLPPRMEDRGAFRWPQWDRPLTVTAIGSLLETDVIHVNENARRARGVAVVHSAPIRRADQGGYGSFGPTIPV